MISVIVPVYKVEPYLMKCLDSIIGQTYRDLEILLIDDCSPDNCGSICDEYAKRDNRIRVFHNEVNRGLSAARNVGLDNAKGEWIMFVDSDDWVDPSFCSTPMISAQDYNVDLVVFRSRTWNGRNNSIDGIKRTKSKYQEGIVSREIVIAQGGGIVWNKLYKRKLFECVRFPEGRAYEDTATTYKLVYRAQRIMILADILYNHVLHKDSISMSRSERYEREGFLFAMERYNFLLEHKCPSEMHQVQLWNHAMRFLFQTKTKAENDIVVKQAEEIMNSIPGIPSELAIKRRILLLAWKIDKHLFYRISVAFGKRNRKEDNILNPGLNEKRRITS